MATLPCLYRPSKRLRPKMDDLDKRCRALFSEGWTPKFNMIVGGKWECLLDASVNVLLPNIPRPRAVAETMRQALNAADEQRTNLLEQFKKR